MGQCCGSGADAIHWIEALRPTTVYLEIAMPDLNANEGLAWLLPDERPPNVFLLDGRKAGDSETLALCETG